MGARLRSPSKPIGPSESYGIEGFKGRLSIGHLFCRETLISRKAIRPIDEVFSSWALASKATKTTLQRKKIAKDFPENLQQYFERFKYLPELC